MKSQLDARLVSFVESYLWGKKKGFLMVRNPVSSMWFLMCGTWAKPYTFYIGF